MITRILDKTVYFGFLILDALATAIGFLLRHTLWRPQPDAITEGTIALSSTTLRPSEPPALLRYGSAVVLTLLALLLTRLLGPLSAVEPFMFFFAAVLFSAWCGGLGPALLCIFLSEVTVNYY